MSFGRSLPPRPVHRPETGRPQPEDPLVNYVRALLSAQRTAMQRAGKKWPVPLLGATTTRPVERRTFGPIYVGVILQLAENDATSARALTDTALDTATTIYNGLSSLHPGAEGIVDDDTRQRVRSRAEPLAANSGPIRVGHMVLAALTPYGARAVTDDAVLAIELAELTAAERRGGPGQAARPAA